MEQHIAGFESRLISVGADGRLYYLSAKISELVQR
jgi:hypothetical protein